MERKLAEGWMRGRLDGRVDGMDASWAIIHNTGYDEFYPAALAPDKCFSPEAKFKVGDWVRTIAPCGYSEKKYACGRVVQAGQCCAEVDFFDGGHPLARTFKELERIERPSACGKS